MYILSGEIEIGDYLFKQFNSVKIVRSVDLIADTAIISLPTKFVLRENNDKKLTEKAISVGDKVKITLRYENVFENVEFVGYVTKIKPNTPVEIQCEDKICLLRKISLNQNFVNTTLKQVLEYIIKKSDIELAKDIPEVNFDKFILKNVNAAQALQKIKQDYGLSVYLDDDGKLFAGLQQQKNVLDNVIYDFDYNVISQNLEYVKSEDVKIRLKMIGMKKDNTKVKVEVGDPEGELRTETVYSISDPKELKKIGESKLSGYKYSGYRGTITSFYYPFANRAFGCDIRNKTYPDREGRFFVSKVEVEFGENGARRIVTLGQSLGKRI